MKPITYAARHVAPPPYAQTLPPLDAGRRRRVTTLVAALAAVVFVIAGAVTAMAARPSKSASPRVHESTAVAGDTGS